MLNVEGGSNASLLAPPADAGVPIVSESLQDALGSCLQFLILVFSSFGLATNVINIPVFIRQGLASDSCTVCLFSLSIADFLSCLTAVPQTLCRLAIWAMSRNTFESCSAFTSGLFSILHLIVSRIICWLTVYLATERCLVVLFPFHAKSFFTSKTAIFATVLICALAFGAYLSLLVYLRISWVSTGNDSLAVLYYVPPGRVIHYYLSLSFNTILTSFALVIIMVSTGLMTYKLKASIKFREMTSSQGQGDRDLNGVKGAGQPGGRSKARGRREMEVLKTVTMVTGLFLVCLSMSHIPGFVTLLLPGTSINGLNENLFALVYYYKILFDVINSSLNYFFYIRFSSRYKTAFDQLFRKRSNRSTT